MCGCGGCRSNRDIRAAQVLFGIQYLRTFTCGIFLDDMVPELLYVQKILYVGHQLQFLNADFCRRVPVPWLAKRAGVGMTGALS